MFCSHCGNEIPNNSTSCIHCGKSQIDSSTPVVNVDRQVQYGLAPKKKSRKKSILISVLCIVFAVIVISVISNTGDGYNKLEQYEWGSAAEPILRDIGVQKIKEIRSNPNSEYDFYITTEKTDLALFITENSLGGYEVYSIGVSPNSADFGKSYYYKEDLLKDEQGRYLKTLYDYSTNSIIFEADEEAVLEHDQKVAGQLSALKEYSKERIEKKKEEANQRFQTIISDYQNNEVAAESKYKGNTYTVSGTIQDIGLDVVDNPYITLNGDIHVTFYFTKNETEEIAKMNKGDTIVITGTCDGAGVILDLTFSKCQIVSDDEL